MRAALLAVMVSCCTGCGDESNAKRGDDLSVPDDLAVAGEHDLSALTDAGAADAADAGPIVTVDAGNISVNHYYGIDTDNRVGHVTIDHGTGKLTFTNDNGGLSGTVETLASGFLYVTFSDGCDGAGCTPTPGGGTSVPLPLAAHALEVPGYFFYLIPDNGGSYQLGVVGETDSCAGIFDSYNLINFNLAMRDVILHTDQVYMQATLGGSTSAVTVSGYNYTLDADGGAIPPATVPCNQGIVSISGGFDGGTQLFTSGAQGVLLLSHPTSFPSAEAIGLAQNGVTLAQLESHDYAGVLFGYGASTKISPVDVAFVASAVGTGKPYQTLAAVNANTPSSDPTQWVSVTLSSVENGLVRGTMTDGTDGATFVGAALQAGGVNLMVLLGNGDLFGNFNALLVSH